jgi:hypothetical protein
MEERKYQEYILIADEGFGPYQIQKGKEMKYLTKLHLTPSQTFLVWEALNSTWFTNAKKDQLQLCRLLRRQLLDVATGSEDNAKLVDETDHILKDEWLEKRGEFAEQGLTKKGFYAVKNKKREEMGI